MKSTDITELVNVHEEKGRISQKKKKKIDGTFGVKKETGYIHHFKRQLLYLKTKYTLIYYTYCLKAAENEYE